MLGPDGSEPTVEPYRPFPDFANWQARPFDADVVNQFAARLSDARSSFGDEVAMDAVAVAARAAAVDTGAIEGLYEVDRGFTITVATNAAAWQNIHLEKGRGAADAMADALRAVEHVMDAMTSLRPITEVWIRELHAMATASQETYSVLTHLGRDERSLPHGTYKSLPNNPVHFASNTIHSYASPEDTAPEMARFVAELRSEAFLSANPTVQASYAHYAFVCIHPFADGNGRVARLIASVFLFRGLGTPLVIFADQKNEYIDVLEEADRGDYLPLQNFVGERVIDTMQLILGQMRAARVPDVKAQMKAMQGVLIGIGGLPHSEVDAVVSRLLGRFRKAIETAIVDEGFEAPLSAKSVMTGASSPSDIPAGYRTVPSGVGQVMLSVISGPPGDANEHRGYSAAARLPGTEGADFVIYSRKGRIVLEANLRDLHPSVSRMFDYLVTTEAATEVRELTSEVVRKAAKVLAQRGYTSDP